MNAETIVELLAAVGVPAGLVSVGVEADQKWCLVPASTETGAPGWEVFWREQGNRYDWARFTSEQVACHYLFGRLTWSQVVRGAVGVLPADQAPAPAAEPVPAAVPDEPDTGKIPVQVIEEAAQKA